jgi:hypothetical protein
MIANSIPLFGGGGTVDTQHTTGPWNLLWRGLPNQIKRSPQRLYSYLCTVFLCEVFGLGQLFHHTITGTYLLLSLKCGKWDTSCLPMISRAFPLNFGNREGRHIHLHWERSPALMTPYASADNRRVTGSSHLRASYCFYKSIPTETWDYNVHVKTQYNLCTCYCKL